MGKCWRLRCGRLGQLLLRLFVQEMDCEGRCGRETAGLAIFTGEGGAARMEKKMIKFTSIDSGRPLPLSSIADQ